MTDTATAERIRLIVGDIHNRGEIVRVYSVAQEIRLLDGGHDLEGLTNLIAQEAVLQRASICWDKADGPKANGHDEPSQTGEGTAKTTAS
jgi:hypothetical protein